MRRVRSKAGSRQKTISSKPIPILVTRYCQRICEIHTAIRIGSQGRYIMDHMPTVSRRKQRTSATENTQVVPTVRQMPETIHNVIVFPNGKVIAEETVPFIDVMLGERAARKKKR